MRKALSVATLLLLGIALGVWINGVHLGTRSTNQVTTSLVPARSELHVADSLFRRWRVASATGAAHLTTALAVLGQAESDATPTVSATAVQTAISSADSLMGAAGSLADEGRVHLEEGLVLLDGLNAQAIVSFDQIDAFARTPLFLALFSLVGLLLFTDAGREILRQSGLSRLSFSGAAFDLGSPAGGRQIEATFRNERSQLERRLWDEVDRLRIRPHLNDVVEKAILHGLSAEQREQWNPRATVYIPDPILDGALTQIVDYVGRGENRITRGRTYNERYGIIGSSWRAQESQSTTVSGGDESTLIEDWGMTVGDVSKRPGRGAQSYMSVLLTAHEGSELVGLVYVDAMPPALFGGTAFVDSVTTACNETGLTLALTKIFDEFVRTGPRIQIFDE